MLLLKTRKTTGFGSAFKTFPGKRRQLDPQGGIPLPETSETDVKIAEGMSQKCRKSVGENGEDAVLNVPGGVLAADIPGSPIVLRYTHRGINWTSLAKL